MPDAIEQLERSVKLYRGLVEVSALINAITDFNELLSAILDVARRVMNAEASSLFLVDEEGNLRLTLARNADSMTELDIVVPSGQGIAGWVFEHNEPLLVRDAYEDPRFFREADMQSGFRTRSILCVPLQREGRVIGVLQVLNPADRGAFDDEDLEAFNAYGQLSATAIDKLRAMERQAEQRRVEQELAFAREIQNSFLPQRLPGIAGIDFGATYRAARNISGDFYDVLEMGPDELYFVIGDVSGKGIPAALLMAQSLSSLRSIIRPGIAPEEALAEWNRTLCGRTVRGMFITSIVGRIVPSKRTVEFASAGHLPPIRLGPSGLEDVEMRGGPPVGLLPDIPFTTDRLELETGSWLIFFTDGLVESFDPDDNLLEREGVKRLLNGTFRMAQDVVSKLVQGEAAHRRNADPSDDLTLLVFGFR